MGRGRSILYRLGPMTDKSIGDSALHEDGAGQFFVRDFLGQKENPTSQRMKRLEGSALFWILSRAGNLRRDFLWPRVGWTTEAVPSAHPMGRSAFHLPDAIRHGPRPEIAPPNLGWRRVSSHRIFSAAGKGKSGGDNGLRPHRPKWYGRVGVGGRWVQDTE